MHHTETIRKTLKFSEGLVPLILSGEKKTTWRLFDDKDLHAGDKLSLLGHDSLREFARAKVLSVTEKSFGQLDENDLGGHERFTGSTEMLETYRGYYGERVTAETMVKVIRFEVTQ